MVGVERYRGPEPGDLPSAEEAARIVHEAIREPSGEPGAESAQPPQRPPEKPWAARRHQHQRPPTLPTVSAAPASGPIDGMMGVRRSLDVRARARAPVWA